jgi:UDP-2,4-diacetamido-2,4,6-trideoxy-beta-L-altropyranose hydrolase
MRVVFRADSSAKVGTGHVARCLTLANALAAQDVRSTFVSRSDAAELERIRKRGHDVVALVGAPSVNRAATAHSDWLDGDPIDDARETWGAVESVEAQWLVVDHYALDAEWESAAAPAGVRVMAIDDLADRSHACDVLLDQNLGRNFEDYDGRVPADCRRLIGPSFALLRPQFAQARARLSGKSLDRRFGVWLACAGGVDPHDVLGKVVRAWRRLGAPRPRLLLVVGSASPNLDSLKRAVADLDGADLRVDVEDMAELMERSGLFIGASGGLSWERCCLGLPAITGFVAENQLGALTALLRAGAGLSVGDWRAVSDEMLLAAFEQARGNPELFEEMGARALQLVDGQGADRVVRALVSHG